jgi:hypothetical protein
MPLSLNSKESQASCRDVQALVLPRQKEAAVLRRNGFAENFIRTNPQFNMASLRSNGAH